MKILTASNKKFKHYLDNLEESAEKFGYEVEVYDLDKHNLYDYYDFDFNELEFDSFYKAKCPYKPALIRQIFDEIDDFFVYMDADIEILENFDEVMTDDYDIGIMAHPQDHHFKGQEYFPAITAYLNAGVMYIQNTEQAKKFLDRWIDLIPETVSGSDQEALIRLCNKAGTTWERNKVYKLDDIRIKLFPSEIYDYIYYLKCVDDSKAKVLHFAGRRGKNLIK